jgi:hypothetical protein
LADLATGEGFLLGLDESWSPWDSYHRPLLNRALGEAAERQGRTEDAIKYYSRLVDLWRDCDPELVAERDSLAAKLRGLIG